MSNLSKPMRDVIMAATDEGLLTVGAARTVTALKTRGLVDDSGLNLLPAGMAVRAELLSADQGDVNPREDQYAEWERVNAGADKHITDYLADEDDRTYLDRNYTPGDMTEEQYRSLTTETPSQNAVETTNDNPEGEDTREAVPGLTKLLDTPHVVPNRKDKRNRKRIVRAFNRLFARKRDQAVKAQTEARKAARKRGRRVSA